VPAPSSNCTCSSPIRLRRTRRISAARDACGVARGRWRRSGRADEVEKLVQQTRTVGGGPGIEAHPAVPTRKRPCPVETDRIGSSRRR
jgi:hypothetical protein